MEQWEILQALCIRRDEWFALPHLKERVLSVHNVLDLSAELDKLLGMVNVTGALVGSRVRTYTGQLSVTGEAIVVTMRRKS